MRLARTRVLLTALAGALLLSSCTDDAGGDSSGSPTDAVVTVGLAAQPANLDFTTSAGAAIPQALLTNVYEKLVTVDQEGKIVGQLATDWQLSDDRLTYTFTLAKDVTFSNGADFTAQDAVFSINRVKSDWTTSLKKSMDVVKQATAVDDHTLEVTLSRPSNGWLYAMTTRVGAMFDTDGVADLATKPVGTGPYAVATWNKGDSLTLKRRDDYWGEKPYFATAVLKYFKDGTALNNAMLTGTVNVVGTVQAPESLA
ncbi:MAG: peptide ABC transporter substrate-binding protein, partial [Micrococcales bacterium]